MEEVQNTILEQVTNWLGSHTGAFIRVSEITDAAGIHTEGSARTFFDHVGAFVTTEEAISLGEKLMTTFFGGN